MGKEGTGFGDLLCGRESKGCSISTTPARSARGATPVKSPSMVALHTSPHPPPHSPPHMAICTLCTGVLRPPRTSRSCAISHRTPTARASNHTHHRQGIFVVSVVLLSRSLLCNRISGTAYKCSHKRLNTITNEHYSRSSTW